MLPLDGFDMRADAYAKVREGGPMLRSACPWSATLLSLKLLNYDKNALDILKTARGVRHERYNTSGGAAHAFIRNHTVCKQLLPIYDKPMVSIPYLYLARGYKGHTGHLDAAGPAAV